MPLRSRIRPRLGTIGTTAVRLLSAWALQVVVAHHLQVDQARSDQREEQPAPPGRPPAPARESATGRLLRCGVRSWVSADPARYNQRPARPALTAPLRPGPGAGFGSAAHLPAGGRACSDTAGGKRSGGKHHSGRFSSGSGARRCGAQQHHADHRPQQGSTSGASSRVQPGKMPPPIMRIEDLDAVRHAQTAAAPAAPATAPETTAGGGGSWWRRNSAWCTPAHAGPAAPTGARPCTRPNMKASADAHAQRLVHVPEHQHQRQQVGHPGHAAQRQHVQQQRHDQAGPDEHRVGRQQQLLARAHDHLLASFFGSGRRDWPGLVGGRGGIWLEHRLDHHHVPRAPPPGPCGTQIDARQRPIRRGARSCSILATGRPAG